MKRLELYIPLAINVVEDLFLQDDNKVASEYDNLASKFGVTIRQLGLKSAIVAFSGVSKGSDVQKELITKAVLRIIRLSENGICREEDTLMDLVWSNSTNSLLKPKIIEAAVALKLALRLFTQKEDKTKEDEES